MPIPKNAQTIYQFLTAHGFNANAAAGWLGNIAQESGGDPAAGSNPPGGGLIQKLGYPTTNTLLQNMQEIIFYTQQNGSIADINAHAQTPQSAALYISQRYERPGIPNNANRIQSAVDVANAAHSGNWSAGGGAPAAGGGGGGGGAPVPATLAGFFPNPFALPGEIFKGVDSLLHATFSDPLSGIFGALGAIAHDLNEVLKGIQWLFVPNHWVRIGAFVIGVAVAIPGVNNLSHAGSGDLSLATGILMVTGAGILFFIAFHNLPDDVKDLRGLLGWLSEGIRTKKAPTSAVSSPSSVSPAPAPPRTPPPGSHPAVTTPKPPQVPTPQPAPGG